MIDPNDSFSHMYETIAPSENSVLIVALEEVDCIVHQIHHGLVVPHKYYPIAVKSKTDWNNFFDKLSRFPFVIFIMTSNKGLDYFDGLDQALMRPLRISLRHEMNMDVRDLSL